MKLYILQQNTYTEANGGYLQYAGTRIIGVYTSLEIPTKIVDEFIPVTYYAQFGKGLQSLFITEIDSDTQLNNMCVDDGLFKYGDNYHDEDAYNDNQLNVLENQSPEC